MWSRWRCCGAQATSWPPRGRTVGRLAVFSLASAWLRQGSRLSRGFIITDCVQWGILLRHLTLNFLISVISYILFKGSKDLNSTHVPEAIAVHSCRSPFSVKQTSNEFVFPLYSVCIHCNYSGLFIIIFYSLFSSASSMFQVNGVLFVCCFGEAFFFQNLECAYLFWIPQVKSSLSFLLECSWPASLTLRATLEGKGAMNFAEVHKWHPTSHQSAAR